MRPSTVRKWQVAGVVAQIVTAGVIPLAVVWATNQGQAELASRAAEVQRSIAAQAVETQKLIAKQQNEKELFQTALDIVLRPASKGENQAARDWALKMIEHGSPVDFGPDLRDALASFGGGKDDRLASEFLASFANAKGLRTQTSSSDITPERLEQLVRERERWLKEPAPKKKTE